MELSYKEIKTYYLENLESLETLKNKIKKKYKENFLDNMSNKDFLDWFFNESSIYIKQSFIEISPKLKRFFNFILINDKPFVRASIYYDEESNIPLYSFSIDNKRKHFLTKEEVMEEYNLLVNSFSKFNNFASQQDYLCFDNDIYLETEKDFFGNYIKNGKECCLFSLSKIASNLDLWTIHLGGTDDYSISKDFLSKEEAYKEKDRLLKLKKITDSEVSDYYFSN